MVVNGNGRTIDFLQKTVLFDRMSTEDITAIFQMAHTFTVKRREFLFHQGERATSFYILLDGNMRFLQTASTGQQVVMKYIGPGDAAGIVVVLADTIYPGSAEASTDCVALGWDRETAVSLIELFPILAVNISKLLSVRFLELQNRYRELATEQVEQRLARAILRLSQQRNGQAMRDGVVTLNISRQDLAELIGTTLFSVSRLCSSWEQLGVIAAGREKITILEPDSLLAIAEKIV